MKKLTIKGAILEALKKKNKPLTSKEIYATILEEKIYQFNSKTPESVLKAELRKNCEDLNLKIGSKDKCFKLLPDGKYWLKDVAIPK